jgi:hypothetical protein
VIAGEEFTVNATVFEVTDGVHEPLTTTSKVPAIPAAGFVIVNVAVVTLLYGAVLVRFIPFLLHWYVRPDPVAVTLMVTVPLPAQTADGATGCKVITGEVLTVNATTFDITGGVHVPDITTSKLPASPKAGFVIVNVAVVTLLYGAVLVRLVPFLLH